MTTPQRLQLRRTAGWRLQDVSRALNGLPARSLDAPCHADVLLELANNSGAAR